VPPEAPARWKHRPGQRHERAGNEDDPDFYPLWVIYGGHCPGGYVLAQSFPWIGTPMTVGVGHLCPWPPLGLAASACVTARASVPLRRETERVSMALNR
jgi:hypothetical protein